MTFAVHLEDTSRKISCTLPPAAAATVQMQVVSSSCSTQSTTCHTPLSSDGSTFSSENMYYSEAPLSSTHTKKHEVKKLTSNGSSERHQGLHSVEMLSNDGKSLSPTGKRSRTSPLESDNESSLSTEDSRSHYRLRRRKLRPCSQEYDIDNADNSTVDISELLRPPKLPPIEHFANVAGVPRPEYEHILQNDYSGLETQANTTGDGAQLSTVHGSLGDGTSSSRNHWVCDCCLPSRDDLLAGRLACGQGCINRALNIECGPRCPAVSVCGNRQFQLRLYADTEPYFCGPEKGWGLRALKLIPKGKFIVEYAGEVIDFYEFRRRIRIYEKAKRAHHYFMSLGPDHFIDAGTKGNWARFVNHSCEPNTETQKWTVNGRLRIGFFAKKDIVAKEEITIDYQFVQYGVTEQKCYCGTSVCSGIMGATSKQLQDKVRLKDTRAVERGILQLLMWKSLRTAKDMMLLLQVMVQEYLTRYARLELLKLLAGTSNETYLKLFQQYNGLELLASYMCDVAQDDWELKHQILVCLDNIPVSEQKQVRTESCLMDIIKQWTADPRFCRPRTRTDGELSPVSVDLDESEDEGVVEAVSDEGSFMDHRLGGAQCGSCLNDEVKKPLCLGSTMVDPTQSTNGQSSFGLTIPPGFGVSKSSTERLSETEDLTTCGAPGLDEQPELAKRVPLVAEFKVYSPKESRRIIRRIRKLASVILDRWSKLPLETYRIPRIERQETEESIRKSAEAVSSGLVSWGSSQDEDYPNSWKVTSNYFSFSKSLNDAQLTASSEKVFLKSDAQDGRRLCHQRHRTSLNREVIRTKHRKRFEADMRRAAESTASSFLVASTMTSNGGKLDGNLRKQPDTSLSKEDIAETVRQLLLKALAQKLTNSSNNKDSESELKEWMSSLSKNLCELARQHDTTRLMKYLQCIAGVQSVEVVNEAIEVKKSPTKIVSTEEKKEQLLPVCSPPWCSTLDTASGRVYYYNSITRDVQWDPPVGKKNVHKAPSPLVDKRDFLKETYGCVLKIIRPYRLPNCLTGRIESDDDMKHLARKLAFALAAKERRRCRPNQPTMSSSLVDRFRRKITHYMTSRGEVYTRFGHKESVPGFRAGQEQPTTSEAIASDCDMEIDDG